MRAQRVATVLLCAVLIAKCTRREVEAPLALPPAFYSSSPIVAQVVDSSSGQPIAAAVIAAIWRRIDPISGRWDGVFLALETTTDREGKFKVQAWGPRSSANAVLDRRDPELWVIARGYIVTVFDETGPAECLSSTRGDVLPFKLPPSQIVNARPRDFAREAQAGSRWTGGTLKLRRASSADELARSLSAANPRDPYAPVVQTPLPGYFGVWRAMWAELPGDVRRRVSDPPLTALGHE